MDIDQFNFNKIFRDINRHVEIRLKAHQSKRTLADARFYEAFETLSQILEPLKEHQEILLEGCSRYDFVYPDGTVIKGNGYRSLLYLLSCLLQQLHDHLVKISKNIGNLTFSSVKAVNNLCVYCRALQGMEVILCKLAYLMQNCPAPQLFNNGTPRDEMLGALAHEYLCRDVFYGKLHGFQYTPTMKPLLYMINLAMASYEKSYNADRSDSTLKHLASSVITGGKYVKNSSQRGMKLDKLTTDTSVYFVKAFWSLLEKDSLRRGMKLMSPSVAVRQLLEVPARTLRIEGSKGVVELTPPSGEIGCKPIPLLLLSHKKREGQEMAGRHPLPPATGLVFHMHGGGFVAQSPKSHEFYLRKWTNELETPIVSVDYSLAPEAPFPRALEECLMAYVWVLQNAENLGTTAERIVFAGDSAGGSFALTVAMKANELGLRLPNAILSVYPSTNITCAASPSRALAVMDPLLPLGILLACQQAYSGQVPSDDVLLMRKEYRERIFRARGYLIIDPDNPHE